MKHSKAAHTFATESMNAGSTGITFDLSRCEALDSTFLGCLIDLHQQFGDRVALAAPMEQICKLMGATKLERILRIAPAVPQCYGDAIPLVGDEITCDDLAEHIVTCHRRLAEIESPLQPVFARLADRLEREHSASTDK